MAMSATIYRVADGSWLLVPHKLGPAADSWALRKHARQSGLLGKVHIACLDDTESEHRAAAGDDAGRLPEIRLDKLFPQGTGLDSLRAEEPTRSVSRDAEDVPSLVST